MYFVFLVLFSAYDGKVTSKSRGNASIISQSNLYEDVRSQISEDPGWSSSEFDSDSTTDYENPPDFDIIDKPLPLTPKEMARSPAEVR